MKKNILIGLLALVSVFFVVYANIKANEAEKQRLQAELNIKLAYEQEAKAKAQEQKATEAAAKALIEQKKAENLEEQLKNCRK